MVITKMDEEIKRKLQHILDNVATEIKKNGVSSLYTEGQLVCAGRIVIEIGTEMLPVVRYEREVCILWGT